MVRKWFSSLLELLYPSLCAVCQKELVAGEGNICTECLWEMPLTGSWGRPDNEVIDILAGRIPLKHASALFYFSHHSGFRKMIHRMKYQSRSDLARSLGELYGRYLQESGLYDDVDLLLPVPLHWTKRISRGYNQSTEICRGMAKSMQIGVDSQSLRRIRRTDTQARKSRSARWSNVQGAFALRRNHSALCGKHILLIDDVLTTGSTFEACAEALATIENITISVGALAVVRHK